MEVHGERGALPWDFRRMGELRVALDQDFTDAAYATLFCRPGDGELGAFQPGAGIAMGFDALQVVQLHRLVTSIATGQPEGATIEDAVRAAELVDAIGDSADRRAWVTV